MPRLLSLGTALAVAAVSVASVVPFGNADAATKSSTSKTYYIMSGSGYGTSVTGGSVPADVGKTGLVTMGCVSVPGKTHKTETVGVGGSGSLGADIPLKIGAVGGNIHTRKENGGLGVVTNHHIASISLVAGNNEVLKLGAITSTANAWHNKSGYHTSHGFSLASISVGGVALPLSQVTDLLKGQSLPIPGVATLSLDSNKDNVTKHHAFAQTRGLTVTVPTTNTKIVVGSAQARIRDTTTPKMFRGNAELIGESSALDGLVTLGPNTLLPMQCDGTQGKVKSNDVASLPIGGSTGSGLGLDIGAGTTWNRAAFNRKTGTAYHKEVASLASINLAGQLQITGLKAEANAFVNKKGKLTVNDKGTTVGSITAAGKTYSLPAINGKSFTFDGTTFGIRTNVITKPKDHRGIDVVALEIQLGPLATIDLGHVHAEISKAINKYHHK